MPHDPIKPSELGAAVGFRHGVLAETGRTLFLAGQNGALGGDGTDAAGIMLRQFDDALGRIIIVLRAAGGEPADVTQLTICVTDMSAYRAARDSLGAVWRRHFGRYYPAMTLIGVSELYEPDAVVEIDGVAVIPVAGLRAP